MRVFFSVGEPSGDQHAAHLIHEMRKRRPDFKAVGYGGPAMQAAGCELRFQLTNLAVMGFLRVVPLLRQFIALAKRAAEEFKENPPDAVVLVDFPGFNWHIAKAAKKVGVPVYYYMPPQLWAWGPWRVRKVRKFIKQVLCALPFEHDWYTKRGVNATYVGHPFFDEVAEKTLDAEFVDQLSGDTPLVAVLPGSRTHEVERNLPLMAKVISRLQKKHPEARFVVASYNEEQETLANKLLSDAGVTLPSYIDRTSEVIEAADCCLMVSGSVSLELLARKTPGAVVYRLTRLHTTLRPVVIGCKYITLTNLIAGRELMPEFVSAGSEEPTVESLVGVLDRWLGEPGQLAAVTRELTELAESAVLPGATGNAADVILSNATHRERLAA
jgi:lipid-A-disaccharide synthase